jgi:uncharacterized protein (TIGR03085 family)
MARTKTKGWGWLVEKVRSGPPPGPFMVPVLRELINLAEYFIHHEDVRRANGDGPRPATETAEVEAALWRQTRRGARFQARRVPSGIGLVLATPEGERVTARSGGSVVTITGRPGELTLYLAGRRAAADVDIDGDADAVARVREANLAL